MVEQGGETLSANSLESPSEGEFALLPNNSGVAASLDEACAASVMMIGKKASFTPCRHHFCSDLGARTHTSEGD